MWAAEGLLRLFSRCCVGRLGAELRQSLIDDAGVCACASVRFSSQVCVNDACVLSFTALPCALAPGFTFPRLLQLSYDDKVCFPIRVQLVHLLRSLHISPALVSESAAVLGAAAIATTSSAGGTAAVGRSVACPSAKCVHPTATITLFFTRVIGST
jgi:hypothetical protein